jgi:hypothetical protein
MNMADSSSPGSPIRAGDVEGLGRVYSETGIPILSSGETLLGRREACDLAAYGSWRIIFPKRLFHPLSGKPSGTMYVTTERLIFLREIDIWKEVKSLLTPLGLPAAAEKESKLKQLRAAGARQFCEIFRYRLQVVQTRRKSWGLLHLRLLTVDGAKYEVFVYTDRNDSNFFDLVEGTFRGNS